MYYYKTKQKKIFLIILLLTSGLLILFLYQKEKVKQEIDILCLNFSLNEKVCLEEDVLFYDQSNNIYLILSYNHPPIFIYNNNIKLQEYQRKLQEYQQNTCIYLNYII